MSQTPVRKIDRQRRQRVIEGALDTIYEYGVEGMTHRRVAEAADVSVGATTYYFRSLEDLLEAAMRHAAERDIAALRDRFGDSSHPAEIAEVLTAYLFDAATVSRREAVIVAELYVAALRRPALREVGQAWNAAWIELLTPSLGAAAQVITVAIAGLAQRAVLAPDDLSRAELRADIDLLLHAGE